MRPVVVYKKTASHMPSVTSRCSRRDINCLW